MSLSIQILTKNNEKTIEKCLNSLKKLQSKITIVDLGSDDKTIKIINSFKINVIKTKSDNLSNLRNSLKTDSKWKMYIHPYEYLASGHEEINKITTSTTLNSFTFKIAQGSILTTEIRLWNKPLQFINPVFETLKDDLSLPLQCICISNQENMNLDHKMNIIDKWLKDDPTNFDPYYYQALVLLMQGKYLEFNSIAEHYLFKEKSNMSSVMLRYYLSMSNAYYNKDYNQAIKNVLHCISFKPIMPEFWCLLGDIHYKIKSFNKAIVFYENAIILGERKINDNWPIDLSKYKEHPEKMINLIKETLKKVSFYK